MADWTARLVMGAVIGGAVAFVISVVGADSSPELVLQAQVMGADDEQRVSEEELALYIEVYTAMQGDRTLKIADAVAARETTLSTFRSIERRVQLQGRLVQRVREALLEHAKENANSLAERGVAAAN